MPTYDYRCSQCNSVWEERHSINDRHTPHEKPCPVCSYIGSVQKTLEFTALNVSYVSETSRAIKELNKSKFAERMNQIHADTPGSIMNKSSNLVDVS